MPTDDTRKHSCYDERQSIVVNGLHIWQCRKCGAQWHPSHSAPDRIGLVLGE